MRATFTRLFLATSALVLTLYLASCGKTPSNGEIVYDTNGVKLGALNASEGYDLGILFSDSAYGRFSYDGTYSNGSCINGNCSPRVYMLTNSQLYFTDPNTTSAYHSKSYAFFTTADCSGTPYLPNPPTKNSIYRTGTTSFYKASGTESKTTSLTFGSTFLYDLGSCTSLTYGTGICCSNITPQQILGVTWSLSSVSGYPLSTTYSFPSALPSYPFAGSLYSQ